MECTEKEMGLLRKVQEMEFVVLELNLYLDTHPCDEDAINDFNCAVETLQRIVKEYEEKVGPLSAFMSYSGTPWQWVEEPWPWEI